MTAGNDLGFSTDWVTDMGLLSGVTSETVADGSGSFDIVTHSYGYYPVSVAHWMVQNSGTWFDASGAPTFSGATGNNLRNGVHLYVEITTSKLICHYDNNAGANRTIEVRYWVYENDLKETL